MENRPLGLSRRRFLGASALLGSGFVLPGTLACGRAPAIVTSEALRPQVPSGVQTGDVTRSRALVWSRTDRPARLVVEWATNERFENARALAGPVASADTGFTAAIDLAGLPAGEQIVYRARFESVDTPGALSEPVVGRFRTAPVDGSRPVRVVWSGDTVGQGWGIDPDRGGLRMYDTLLRAEPDVFIHSGDMIYADNPLAAEVPLADGTIWRNLVTEAKSKVAETIDEFRGNFAYHLIDEQARRFHASVPMIAQWDDHEVCNNWFDGLQLDDPRYTVKDVSTLARRAKQAMFESVPIRRSPDEAGRVYRHFSWGPLLDVFVVDLRSYRGPNSPNRQGERSTATALLGDTQLAWLKTALARSRAEWKVVASDMPIGLVVSDREREGLPNFEAWANADGGPPSGRELELADLLSFLKRERVRNVVWVTADVHYAAAHHYAPERAAFTDFDPFWEFVAGPMHAGTFGPGTLDGTFGPEVRFASVEPRAVTNNPPSDGLQFYGQIDIDPATRRMTVGLYDVTGRKLWEIEL